MRKTDLRPAWCAELPRRSAIDIVAATRAYERWLRARLPLLPVDLRAKHKAMAQGAFPFLRATFYRWAQTWPLECRALADAPRVLAVGDVHVENFGTWRDAEGRLVWGVNDFDEACVLPYTSDLVRLAASAVLAIREDRLSCREAQGVEAVLDGYAGRMEAPGEPFVLAERHRWLRQLAQGRLRAPKRYWRSLNELPDWGAAPPADVRAALTATLPDGVTDRRIVHRQAGLGSLGRRRFALIGRWRGAWIAREAKELTTSAGDRRTTGLVLYRTVVRSAVRAEDPFLRLYGNWVVRRLSPDCSRIQLRDLPRERDERRLLRAMGAETANVHGGNEAARRSIVRDLVRRPRGWLVDAAAAMAESFERDWRKWRQRARNGA